MSQIRPDSNVDDSYIKPITTREELVNLLVRASELEHGLACFYLFTAYSLKNDVSEGGLTDAQASIVRKWRRSLMSAASDRMLHLAQISNLLTAIGGAPHVTRPPFSVSDSAGAGLTLEPFSQVTIDRLVTYERLDARIVTPNQPSSAGVEHVQTRDNNSGHLEPDPGEYTTIRDLYDKIAAGFRSLPAEELFIVR